MYPTTHLKVCVPPRQAPTRWIFGPIVLELTRFCWYEWLTPGFPWISPASPQLEKRPGCHTQPRGGGGRFLHWNLISAACVLSVQHVRKWAVPRWNKGNSTLQHHTQRWASTLSGFVLYPVFAHIRLRTSATFGVERHRRAFDAQLSRFLPSPVPHEMSIQSPRQSMGGRSEKKAVRRFSTAIGLGQHLWSWLTLAQIELHVAILCQFYRVKGFNLLAWSNAHSFVNHHITKGLHPQLLTPMQDNSATEGMVVFSIHEGLTITIAPHIGESSSQGPL